MSAEENKATIRRWIEEAWNQGKINIADEIYAAGFTMRDVGEADKVRHGPESIKKDVVGIRTAFPDIKFTIDHLLADGNMVVGSFTITATHTGEFLGMPPTGKKVEFAAIDIWRFENGKIVERCIASVDRLGMMQQLGVIPPIGKKT